MPDDNDVSNSGGSVIGDLAGTGQIVNSEIAKRTYNDALSPAMKELGGLSEDTLKTFRLFTAPLQLLAAYQDRFRAFCDRVREKVPEEHHQDAPPEIARPVMEAFASTRDDSPLMDMFEELMAKAIDKREADKLSPEFPRLIQSLSPLQALMVADLRRQNHITDDLTNAQEHLIVQRVHANFQFDKYGGHHHHLTLCQDLKEKNVVNINENVRIDVETEYPNLTIPDGLVLTRTVVTLAMYGRWFASACVRDVSDPIKPR